MCVGIPMRVLVSNELTALCEGSGRQAEIDMRLVGDQPVGTWVLTFLGAARDVIDEVEAARISDALRALAISTQGGIPPDDLFADLIGRTPELPEFLRPASKETI